MLVPSQTQIHTKFIASLLRRKNQKEKEKGRRSRRQRKTNLNTDFAVMLHALELLDPLLNDIALDQRRDHCC